MNNDEFKEGLRVRMDEFKEFEELVTKFAFKIRGKSVLLKSSMKSAYREGMSDLLMYLDHKAIKAKKDREAVTNLTKDTRGS